jgi:hypothetical protein
MRSVTSGRVEDEGREGDWVIVVRKTPERRRRNRYLLVSTMRFPEVAERLDTGTILADPRQ